MLLLVYSAILSSLNIIVEGLPFRAEKLQLEDVFISVKTTGKFHQSRVMPILDTWHSLAPGHTWFFTDTEDEQVSRRLAAGQKKTQGSEFSAAADHLVQTGCPRGHSRQALCCKMQAEIETYLSTTDRKWFCHVDDDNYVNVPALLRALAKFDSSKEHYLGKISISKPLQIYDKQRKQSAEFFFGTGGAGFCLSRPVVERMSQLSETLSETGARIGLPDDVTVGYMVTVLLDIPLTQLQGLHSHLEPLGRIAPSSLSDQITLSYGQYEDGRENHVMVPGFDIGQDPTTMHALHCNIFGQCSGQLEP